MKQSILAVLAGIAAFIGVQQYAAYKEPKPEYDSECKGAMSKEAANILFCWSGNEWVKPERLK